MPPTTHRPQSALQAWLIAELRAGMAVTDMTGVELAQAAGISPKHVSQVLNGAATGTVELWDFLLSLVGRRDQIVGRHDQHQREGL